MRVDVIGSGHERLIKENLLAFKGADAVIPPDLIGIGFIPVKTGVLGEI